MHTNQLINHFETEKLITSISQMHTPNQFASETLLVTGLTRLSYFDRKYSEHTAVPDRIQLLTPMSLL